MANITTIDPKNAIIEIQVPVGSQISVFKNDSILQNIAMSMGIIDSTNIGLAHYYIAIEPENFGTIIFQVSYDSITNYSLEASINRNKYYFYSITDFT